MNSPVDDAAEFRIISFDGKELLNRRLVIQSGENIILLKELEYLPAGNYILEVTTSTDKYIKKLLK
jgi:hypothetical protein